MTDFAKRRLLSAMNGYLKDDDGNSVVKGEGEVTIVFNGGPFTQPLIFTKPDMAQALTLVEDFSQSVRDSFEVKIESKHTMFGIMHEDRHKQVVDEPGHGHS